MLIHTVDQWNPLWLSHLQKNQRIGLVPTMGALHEGHLDLIRKSIQQTDFTIVSIFVNPIQFNHPEDFQKYPNTLDADLSKLESLGVDYVFLPEVTTIYPAQPNLKMDFGDLETILEGKFRPGHFNGVGIVVAKLFHLIRPQVAFFGQKDLQQVAVIKRLVQDLSFPIELQVIPTRREQDGLAMSSRNLRLTKEQRQKSLTLFQSLSDAKSALLRGEKWSQVKENISARFNQIPDCQLEYFELVHPETFNLFQEFDPHMKSSICVAAYIGDIRLIDNMPVQD